MKKSVIALISLCFVFAIGCSGNNQSINLDASGLVDYQTDVPMLTYAFLKIKPAAAGPMGKFCDGVALAQDRAAIIALLEEKIAENSGALMGDEYTRKWLISKAQRLIGVTIDGSTLDILHIDESVSESKLREIVMLVCEGVKAYKESN